MLNKELIAREEEKQLIEQALDKLIKGDFSVSFLVANPGLGKTYLISQLETFFYENKCTYIKTKFTQYNQDLYAPARELLDEIVKQLLTLDEDSFLLVQKTLKEKLKQDINIILILSPLSSRIFGDKPINPSLEALNVERIIQAMSLFIKETAIILFPLVISIDDAHWGDVFCVRLIKELCSLGDESNYYLIIALRNGFNDELDEFIGDKETIKLKEFEIDEVKELLNIKWNIDSSTLDTLGPLLYNLTKGNPFYLTRMFMKIEEMGVLTPGKTYWELDVKKFSKMVLIEDVEEILEKDVRELSGKEWELLELVSSFSGQISENMLKAFYLGRVKALYEVIELLLKKSLLLITFKNQEKIYSLVHDMLHEVIYKSKGENEKLTGYYEIARVLTKNGFSERYPMMISQFLLKVDKELLLEDVALWFDILYRGGRTALERGSIKEALIIYRFCNKLVENNIQVRETEHYLEFQLSYLRSLFVNEKEEEADALYQMLLKDSHLKEELLQIKMAYIYCYAYNGDWEQVLDLGSEILILLNYRLNLATIPINLLTSRMIYSKKKIEKIGRAPNIKNKRILRIQEVLIVMFPAANRINPKLFTLINLKLAILAGKHGNSLYSSVGYASYCYILFFVFKNYKLGDLLQKVTIELLKDSDRLMYRSISYALIGTFTYHWTNRFKEALSCLNRSREASEIEGEYLYTNYAFVFSFITMYVMGKPLKDIKEYVRKNNLKDRRLENYLTYYMSGVFLAHIENLESGKSQVEDLEGLEKESFSETINLNAAMVDIHRLYLEGKFLEAYELAKITDIQVKKYKGFILNGHYELFSILSRIAAHPLIPKNEVELNHKTIWGKIKTLKKWELEFSPNHGSGYYIAQAEYDSCYNSVEGSEDLYNKAITIAQKEENIQMEALGNLLAARHSASSEKIINLHRNEAVRLYKKWGAHNIAGMIMEEFSISREIIVKKEPEVKVEHERKLLENLSTIVKKSVEESYIYMLDYLIENKYCEKARVLIEQNGEMNLRFKRKEGSKGMYYVKGIHVNYIDSIPHKMIRYSARTEEAVLIGGDEEHPSLIRGFEPLLEGNRFLLAVPLKNMGILTGILFMEKEGEFEVDIIERVNFLYSLVDIEKEANLVKDSQEIVERDNLLTVREVEILRCVGKGMSNSQISEALFIAEGTVRNHLSKIYSKLNVVSRVQAVIVGKERKVIY